MLYNHTVSVEAPPEASAAGAARALDAVCLRGAPVASLAVQLERAGGFLDVPDNPVALYSRQCAPPDGGSFFSASMNLV